MSSMNEINDDFKEKRKRKEEISNAFRDEIYSLSKTDSEIMKKLEDAVLECLNYGWEIDSMLEDDKITPYEFDQLSSHLEKLGEVTKQLEKDDEENTQVINRIICIFDSLKAIIKEVQYTVDIERQFFGFEEYKPINKIGYVIEEEAFLEKLEELVDCLEIRKLKQEDQISKVEREIINAIKTIGLIEKEVTLNVLYTKPSFLMKEIIYSIEVLQATITPIYSLIRGNYFREEIKSARIGISLMSEDKKLNVGEAIKIRWLFNKTPGIFPLEKLSRTLKTVDSDETE